MNFVQGLDIIINGNDLSRTQAESFLGEILDNDAIVNEQVADALIALTEKSVTTEEILGFLAAMRKRMINVDGVENAIDTCGTGGDKSNSFNISTASAIVLAAGGVKVAKHGNRSATSKCGSPDVLEALNIPVDFDPEEAKIRLAEDSFVFLFAQKYHPSLKKLAIVRKQLDFPTVFNILGPLLNPAKVKRQVIGTFNLEKAKTIAEVVSRLDYEHVVVLVSDDGLDEASLSAPTNIIDIIGSEVTEYKIEPKDFDLKNADRSELLGDDAIVNAAIVKSVMEPSDELSSQQRVVVLNAGLGFYVAGVSDTVDNGVKLAIDTIKSSKAKNKLDSLSKTHV
ncbi:anthranilate phosphoribosyltransferase [Candidatus Saccharibacteria bacterium]|jgi:anthranilate phosphoribosyltransferase|nr:anthranilate phosphoribosyltransferase [Candidatus Saccharibacteria bacterium]